MVTTEITTQVEEAHAGARPMNEEQPTSDPQDDAEALSPSEIESSGAKDAGPPDKGASFPNGAPSPGDGNKHWYVVKVQSGRENTIKDAIERRVKIEGLDKFFGQIIIPTEKVTEMRGGKRTVKERKLYPGYLMVEVEYNDRILYLFRETSGVGDFVGGSLNHPPPPMAEHEVDRMVRRQGEQIGIVAPGRPPFERGDRVKVKDGTFAGMEGEVKEILEAKGSVRVELTIFGRPVPVELEYWQVENL